MLVMVKQPTISKSAFSQKQTISNTDYIPKFATALHDLCFAGAPENVPTASLGILFVLSNKGTANDLAMLSPVG